MKVVPSIEEVINKKLQEQFQRLENKNENKKLRIQIQELQTENEELKQEIQKLETQNEKLRNYKKSKIKHSSMYYDKEDSEYMNYLKKRYMQRFICLWKC